MGGLREHADAGHPPDPPTRRGRLAEPLRNALSANRVLYVLVLLVVCVLIVPPLVYLVLTSMKVGTGALANQRWSLEHYREILATPRIASLVGQTLIYAAGSSTLGIVIGTGLAWLVARTDVPLKSMVYLAMMITFALPGIVKVVGWVLLLGPNAGILNVAAQGAGLQSGLFDIFSMQGMIMVEGLFWAPIIFFLMIVPFHSMDPSLEEAASMSGAGQWQVFRKITMPLAMPSILAAFLLSIIRAVESFEVPAVLGIPANVRVVATEIYLQLRTGLLPNYGGASAYSVALVLLVVVLLVVYRRQTSRGHRFATISGKGFRPAPIALGRLRWPAGLVGVLVTVVVLLPLLALVWVSFLPFNQGPSLAAVRSATFDNYVAAANNSDLVGAVRNTLLVGAAAAVVTGVVTFLAAWLIVRTRIRSRALLDYLIALPLILPGIVAGIAVLRAYISAPVAVYGTIYLLMLGYAMKYSPYAMRYSHAGMLQISGELEESAAVSGASLGKVLLKVTLPLMTPALSVAALWVFLASTRELAMPLLLYSPESRVISVSIFELYQDGQFPVLAAFSVMVAVAMSAVGFVFIRAARKYGLSVG